MDCKTNWAKLLHVQLSPKTHKTRRCSFETKLNVDSELFYPKGTRTFESIVLIKSNSFPLSWASNEKKQLILVFIIETNISEPGQPSQDGHEAILKIST